MNTVRHYVSGDIWAGTSDRFQDVYNPATGAVTAQVALGGAADVDHAVAAAKAAQPAWGATPPAKRAEVMFAFRSLLKAHVEELAEMLSSEHGKTRPDALGELARGIEVVELACGIPQLLKGEYSEGVAKGLDSFAIRQPAGVVAGITP
ncbi:MAG: aldehyde dehydrogenase family protein, partial [Rhodospirillaceae bacterium]|nr:aldehyde dehydrogenase family protein [Rhodospirillaceae bacterium]